MGLLDHQGLELDCPGHWTRPKFIISGSCALGGLKGLHRCVQGGAGPGVSLWEGNAGQASTARGAMMTLQGVLVQQSNVCLVPPYPPSSGHDDPGLQADKGIGDGGSWPCLFPWTTSQQQKGKGWIRSEAGILTWTGPHSNKEKYSESCEIGCDDIQGQERAFTWGRLRGVTGKIQPFHVHSPSKLLFNKEAVMNSDQSNGDYFIRKAVRVTSTEHFLTVSWFADIPYLIYSCSDLPTILVL